MILPKSKIVARRNILPTSLKEKKRYRMKKSQSKLTPEPSLFFFLRLTLLRFKSNKADHAVKSGGSDISDMIPHFCSSVQTHRGYCRRVAVP